MKCPAKRSPGGGGGGSENSGKYTHGIPGCCASGGGMTWACAIVAKMIENRACTSAMWTRIPSTPGANQNAGGKIAKSYDLWKNFEADGGGSAVSIEAFSVSAGEQMGIFHYSEGPMKVGRQKKCDSGLYFSAWRFFLSCCCTLRSLSNTQRKEVWCVVTCFHVSFTCLYCSTA